MAPTMPPNMIPISALFERLEPAPEATTVGVETEVLVLIGTMDEDKRKDGNDVDVAVKELGTGVGVAVDDGPEDGG